MASIRGFSLEKVKSVRILFSTFDSRVSAARQVTGPYCVWLM